MSKIEQREYWTAVIPAAGKGTRLGADVPKILYPVAGRTILDNAIATLSRLCVRIVIVCAPDARSAISLHVARYKDVDCVLVEQPEPIGMLDAVQLGVKKVSSPGTLVAWGDLIGLDRLPWNRLFAHHISLTIPVVEKENPYTTFLFNSIGRLEALQSREGALMPSVGMEDTGVFLFSTPLLSRMLKDVPRAACRGKVTGEYNLHPMFEYWGFDKGTLFPVSRREAPVGINTVADVEAYLRLCR